LKIRALNPASVFVFVLEPIRKVENVLSQKLCTGITTDTHSGRATPNGKGSTKAIHDMTSRRTSESGI
jgi:hypothetical protein